MFATTFDKIKRRADAPKRRHQVGSVGLSEGNKCHIISQKTAYFCVFG